MPREPLLSCLFLSQALKRARRMFKQKATYCVEKTPTTTTEEAKVGTTEEETTTIATLDSTKMKQENEEEAARRPEIAQTLPQINERHKKKADDREG